MFHTRAIVLSTKPYREHDELISFFTERFGKRTVLARGTRKSTSKLAASLHSTKMVRCSFVEGRGYPILTSLDHVQSERRAKPSFAQGYGRVKDFYGNYFLYAFLALCDDILYEGDVDEKLWNVLSDVFHRVSTTGSNEKKEWLCIYNEWLRALLEALGINDLPKSRIEERLLLRKAFTDAYYKNPYPLEPFFINK